MTEGSRPSPKSAMKIVMISRVIMVIWVWSAVQDDYECSRLQGRGRIYVCNRLWLSSDLQHVDNLVVSDQLVFPNK